MALNADKPHRWKEDIARSVDQFNAWFMKFAPKAYRDSRAKTTAHVEQALLLTKDLTNLTPEVLMATKIRQLKGTYGPTIEYLLFLCGYFDAGYLGYEAAEGIDWVWEHRIADLGGLGV
jgi:hypothetical protein